MTSTTDSARKSAPIALTALAALLALFPLAEIFSFPAALGALIPAGIVVTAALGYGCIALRALGAWGALDRERWAWAAIAGLGVLGTLQSLLAAAQLFRAGVSALVVLIGLGFLAGHARDARRDAQGAPTPMVGAGWLVALVPAALIVVVRGLAPPTFYDALVYHLGLPMQFAAHGGSVVTVHNMFTAMPLLGEMAAGTALFFGGAEAHGFVLVLEWFLLVASVMVLVRRTLGAHMGKGAGAAAAFVTASMPLVVFMSAGTKPDLLAGLFTVGIFRALAVLVDENTRAPAREPLLRMSALFLGFGCATKTSFLCWTVVIAAMMLVAVIKGRVRTGLFAACVPLVVVGGAFPYVRNALALGNPVYPFANGIFGGPSWIEHTQRLLDADATRLRSLADTVDLWRLPWRLITGSGAPTANEAMGLVPFLGVVLLVVAQPRAQVLWLWAVAAGLSLPFWLLTHALPRYDPFLWIFFGVSGGVGFHLALAHKPTRLFVVAAVAAASAVGLMWNVVADEVLLRRPAALVLQRASRQEFLATAMELSGAYAFLNDNARGGCVFLVTGDARVAHLEVPAVLSEVYTRSVPEDIVLGSSDAAAVMARVRATGATHVLVAAQALAQWRRRGWATFDAAQAERWAVFDNAWGAPVYDDGFARVFAISSEVPRRCAY